MTKETWKKFGVAAMILSSILMTGANLTFVGNVAFCGHLLFGGGFAYLAGVVCFLNTAPTMN